MRKRILVVDDNRLSRQALCDILFDEYDALDAADLNEAEQALRGSVCAVSAVVMTDSFLLSGEDVFARLRGDDKPPPVLVVIDDSDIEDTVLTRGASDIILKPYSERTLKARLKNIIAAREARAEDSAARQDAQDDELEADALINILNAREFARRVERVLASAKLSQHTLLALDVDGVKPLRELFGGEAADEALNHVTNTIRALLRYGDLLGSAEVDRYLIFLRDIPYDAIIEQKARQICAQIRKPYGGEALITASIGISVYPHDGENFAALYKKSIVALNAVKLKGTNNFCFYTAELNYAQQKQEPSVSPMRISSVQARRRMLIVDDNDINLRILVNLFDNEYRVDTAKDGKTALARLNHSGMGYSVVLLDLVMPGMDGFAVMEKMRQSVEMQSIPVIVVSGEKDRDITLRAIKFGATDFVTKPVDPALIRLRVESAISKAENERLRAQNSYLLLQSSEETKYRTVLDSTGTVVIEYEWVSGIFTYDNSISEHIAGHYDSRRLWHILLSDMVADAFDVKSMQELVHSIANDRAHDDGEMLVMLKIPSGKKQWFRMRVYKRANEYQLTNKLIITYVNINDEVLAEEKLRFQAERDSLTGLYNRTTFFEIATQMIAKKPPRYYVMACFDINNFKVVNDQYGSDKGDEILKQVAKIFEEGFEAVGGLVSRITADNFAVLYPASFMTTKELINIRDKAGNLSGSTHPISFSVGRYVVDDLTLSASAMYDRAVIAEASIKGRFDTNVAQYDDSMRDKLIREQEIVNEMNSALTEYQFEVWFQPQYNHASGALIGAEALVRWRHPVKGIISPAEFIPVFERNGFIYELDKYVWEMACVMLRKWVKDGRSPLPVSVNVSRYDLFRDDLVDVLSDYLRKYELPVDLLRLEITESAFSQSTKQIIEVVKKLAALGFTVEIDDFGSGYSSLNTLKNVPAQIVKMDMRFLEDDDDSERGGSILESIVRMSSWLGMSVIAEGVETMEQADFLKSIGCNYVQGYLYGKPMPASEYEVLVSRIEREEQLINLETVENLDNNAFWNPKSMDTLIFNTYVGGACIFEWHNEKINIIRANEKYAKILGGENCTVDDSLNLKWEEHMDADAARATREAIEQAIATGDDVSYEATYYDLFGKVGKTYLRTTFRAIARTANRNLIYATNINLTVQRQAELEKDIAAKQLSVIMSNISGGVTAVVVENGVPRILFSNEMFYTMLGYTKEQFEREIDNPHILTHPDDRERIARETEEVSRSRQALSTVYRIVRRDGVIRWWQSNITIIDMPGVDVPVQLSVANDITALREAEQRERETAARMQAIMDNAGSGITAVILKGTEVEFLFANDYYYALNGYTKEQFFAEVSDPYALANPADRQWVFNAVRNANVIGKTASIEYRLIRRDSSEIWVRTVISTRMIEGIEYPVQFSITTDITSEKRAAEKMLESAEQLKFLNDTAGDLLLRSDAESGIDSVLTKVLNYFGAERAYIFEYNFEERYCVNSYEVCATGIMSNTNRHKRFPLEYAKHWLNAFETSRFYYLGDLNQYAESRADERAVLKAMGVRSTLAVSLRGENGIIGTIGVFNPTLHLTNFDNLAAVGDYVAVILTRRNLNARIANDRKALKDMMNDMPGGFARLRVMPDGALSIEYVNANYCALRGMTYDEIMSQGGENALVNVHPDDMVALRATVTDLVATGETRSFQYRLKRGDGTYVPVNAFGRVSKNEAGETFINVYYTELTEREKQDFTLRETMPYLLAAIMRNSNDLVFAKDKDFNYICCSPAFVKFTRQKSEADVIGKNDYEFWTKEEADHFRGDDMRLFEGGEPLIDYIEQIPSDDGIQHYCRTSKYLLRDSAGEIIGMYGIGRDITQDRTAYEQLKFLTNNIPGGLASYEMSPRENRITYYNDGFCNILGYTREQYARISTTGITNITFKEDVPLVMAQVEALIRDDTPIDCTYRVHTGDGGFKWVNLRGGVAERRGDTLYVNTVLFDVTALKLSEEAARIHEQEMRIAIGQMGGMLCEYDPKTRVLTVPDEYAKLFSLPSGVVPNVPESVIEAGFVDPSSFEVYRAFYDKILSGEPSGAVEYIVLRADGSRHWERVEFSMIYDIKGEPAKAIISVNDTTEQHRQYEIERSRPNLGEANLLVHALFNLTTGETLEYQFSDGREVPEDERTAIYFSGDKLDELFIDDGERERYRAINNAAALLERFKNGETELSLDYRRRLPSGEIIWMRNIKRMVCQPGSSDVLLFDYFYNIEEEKTLELINENLLKHNYDFIARIDGITRAYTILSNQSDLTHIPSQRGDDINAVSLDMAHMFVHPEDRDMVISNTLVEGIMRNLDKVEPYSFTYREVRPDGSTRHKKLTQCYLDRDRSLIIALREDVTELMREEARKADILKAALAAANEETRVKERVAAERLKAIMNNVNGGMTAATMVNGNISYLHINDQYYSMLGYTKQQFESELTRGIFDIIHPDDLPAVYSAVENSEKMGSSRMEFRARKRDGSIIWLRSLNTTCQIAGVDAPVHIAVLIDMTKEREMADALRVSEEQFRIAATIGGRAISRYDIKTGVYRHHDEELLAMGYGEIIENAPEVFIENGNIAPESVAEIREYYDGLRRGKKSSSTEIKILMRDGTYRWHSQKATVIYDSDGVPTQAILVTSDIHETRERVAQYKERAETDPLTGVLNRVTFAQRIDRIVARGSGETLAVMMLDIDGFKLVNDTLGHAAGDKLLCNIADAMRAILRPNDLLCRLGGDEFLICLRNMPDAAAIERKAEQICALLDMNLDSDVSISASIGIALCPLDGTDFVTLYRKVDTALYAVKSHGRNSYAFYNENMARNPTSADE